MTSIVRQRAVLLVGSAFVGVFIALVYLGFEGLLHVMQHLVWDDIFHTETNKLSVLLLSIALGMAFFGARQWLDTKKAKESRPAWLEFLVILLIGFLSLFAGAALGPEAVLIPAALLGGQLVAKRLKLHSHVGLFGLAGFVALFVAFFSSVFGGLLGLYLANKSKKLQLSLLDYVGLALASVAALFTLALFGHHGAFNYPEQSIGFSFTAIAMLLVFFAAGYLYHALFAALFRGIKQLYGKLQDSWYVHGFVASAGLGLLFIAGGYLVQFTGNEAIKPIFQQAAAIGLVGVIWISLVKVVTIAWSLGMGYRGGLIFPFVFVASSIVAAASLLTTDIYLIPSIFVFLAGLLFADRKAKIITGHSGED